MEVDGKMRGTDEDARSEEDAQHVFEEFTLVERLARAVSSIQGMHPDYAFLASELTHALPFDVLGIVLLRHDGQAVRVIICSHDGLYPKQSLHWNVQYHQHPFVDSMFERMTNNPTVFVNEYADGLDGPPSRCGDALSSFYQLHATCIVPLGAESRIFGTLELGSRTPRTYADEETQRLVSAVAQVLATAIERAQLGGNTQIQDRQRQALKNISTALASKVDVTVVLDHITTGISNALNMASLLVTFEASTQRLQLVAKSGLDERQLSTLTYDKEAFDATIIGCTIQQRQPFLSDDIELDMRFPASRELYTQLHMRSVLCYPLIADNNVYGALLLCTPESGGFTPLKVDIVALFANQAAIALREGLLMEAASQRHHFQNAIEQLEREVHEPLSDIDEIHLFRQVRAEVKHTYGMNLSSLLKLIGNNLLTKDERTGQVFTESRQETSVQAKTVRADILSELSRLLVQQEQATHGVRDAWFVSDLAEQCIYINPLGESLCNIRLTDIEQRDVALETIFTPLYPRIRNLEEVRHYLQSFGRNDLPEQSIRCILAQEVLSLRSLPERQGQEELGTLAKHRFEDSADRYYQLIRHSLHDQQGQRIAYALQVCDVTTRVLDERNKSALLSSVSHHLRTPLTTIKAAVTGLLQHDIPWSEQMRREMLEDIDQEADHLTVLIDGLVELSRIEMGALILEKTWCNIEEIVYSAIDKAAHVLVGRAVQVQVARSSPLFYVDYVQIVRVVSTLLENAAQHSRAEGAMRVVIDGVEGGDRRESGAHLTQLSVRVFYQGERIQEREREHVFRSFDGLDTSGNGLGLAICKGIIEAHRGRIWMESVPGGESCFVCTLPIYSSNPVQQR